MTASARYSIAPALREPPPVPYFDISERLSMARAIKLLTDLRLPLCRSIMRALTYDGPLSVTDLNTIVCWIEGRDISQPVISTALAILRRHRVVIMEISGHHHIYSIDTARIHRINRALATFLGSQHQDVTGQRICT